MPWANWFCYTFIILCPTLLGSECKDKGLLLKYKGYWPYFREIFGGV